MEYYQPDPPTIPVYEESIRETAAAAVARAVDRGKLREVRFGGGQAIEDAPVRSLLVVTSVIGDKKVRGAEWDVLVEIEDHGLRPVSLLVSRDGAIVVDEGTSDLPAAPVVPGGSTAEWNEAFLDRFGVALVDGTQAWKADEVGGAWMALEVLDERELQAVAELSLIREAGALGRKQAVYEDEGSTGRIRVYDATFALRGERFVGSVDRPHPAELLALVHELGHAVAASQHREAYRRYEVLYDAWSAEADVARKNEMGPSVEAAGAAYKGLGRWGPVADAWQAARGSETGPTPYGRRSNWEGFAEAFALWHLDEAALRRAMPSGAAWFEQGGVSAVLGPPSP